MLSSRKSEAETVVLINPDATITKHKDYTPKKKTNEFGRIKNPIEFIIIYGFVIFIFINGFNKIKLLSDELISQSTSTLKQGWIFNRKIDLSDIQWRTYRQNFSMYLLFAISFLIASKIFKYILYWYYKHQLMSTISNKQNIINHHIISKMTYIYNVFNIFIGFMFILYLHGTSCIIMILFMSINYGIATLSHKSKYCILITWIYNLIMVFISFHYDKLLSPQNILSQFMPYLIVIDELFQSVTHWNQSYRFNTLRCISFNMDWHYFSTKQDIYKSKYNNTELLNHNDFSLLNYFAYLLYAPLELMGPIISFHEWLIQIKLKFVTYSNSDTLDIDKNQTELSYRNLGMYLFRFVVLWMLNEILLHYYYTNYISRFGYPSETEKRSDYLIILALFSYIHLKLIWCKFNVIWKFSRLWALCDEIVTVENMQRCISNTTSIIDFWKYWHSSFNLFNIRYLYIPLGGNKRNRILNTLIVFIFVFLWHGDFYLKLLFWSLLMFIGICPEIFITQMCLKNNTIKNNKYILAAYSAFNIMVLIVANNIGFGGGLHQTVNALTEFFIHNPWNGIPTFLFCYVSVIMVVIVMYHTRYLKSLYLSK
eukprot:446242_1